MIPHFVPPTKRRGDPGFIQILKSMHVMVLGAGVTGITTAWYLQEAGFTVSVVDRQPGAGLETSFANGGQISISHPEPWSSPAAPFIALRSLGHPDAPLRFRFGTDATRYLWALRFLAECLPHRFRRNTGRIAELAVYSAACLRTLRAKTGIEYEQRSNGIVHLLRHSRDLREAEQRVEMLEQHGIRARLCSRDELAEIEPALTGCADTFAAGIYAPDDESGNAFVFTTALADIVRARGGRFHLDRHITQVRARNDVIRGIETRNTDGVVEQLHADAYVVCLGSHSPSVLRPLGLRLPIYPVKGYSVTVPVTQPDAAPITSLTDEIHRIVCSRLGDQLRVAGTAEINGFDTSVDEDRCKMLLKWVDRNFPGATDTRRASMWAGLRPCTPSNVPLIGPSRYPGLWLNTGHGSLGWTLACGSASRIAAMLCDRR